MAALVGFAGVGLGAQDHRWPTHAHDAARSARTTMPLPVPLCEAWTETSPYPPRPAWDRPAKWDGYNKVYGMSARVAFDLAYQVVVADGKGFITSSTQDRILAVDLVTGKPEWVFYAEGPVRLAPFIQGDHLYFGADDGAVTCLEIAGGREVWRVRPGPDDRRIPGNGRLISAWPVRGGVVVRDDALYCATGVFPSEGVFVHALSLRDGAELWRTRIEQLPAQGHLLASDDRLYVPTGRGAPVVLERASGRYLHQARTESGTYALLVGDTLIAGPGKAGSLGLAAKEGTERLASFNGNHMIVTPELSFLHDEEQLIALDRTRYLELLAKQAELGRRRTALQKELEAAAEEAQAPLRERLVSTSNALEEASTALASCFPWKRPCDCPYSLILVGDLLFAGGDGTIAAYDTSDGAEVWRAPVRGKAQVLAAGNGTLLASTSEGVIHAFRPCEH